MRHIVDKSLSDRFILIDTDNTFSQSWTCKSFSAKMPGNRTWCKGGSLGKGDQVTRGVSVWQDETWSTWALYQGAWGSENDCSQMYTDRLEYQGPRRGSRNEDSGKEPRIETGKEEPDHGLVASLGSRQEIFWLSTTYCSGSRQEWKKRNRLVQGLGAQTLQRESWVGLWLCSS